MVLRMLYIKDLRKLQTQIDEMIVQVQVSTAGSPWNSDGQLCCVFSVMHVCNHQMSTHLASQQI